MYGDPMAPFMWRADGKLAPTGIVGDTGSHIFSFMEFLVGRVSSLIADNLIVTPKRPVVEGLAYGEQVKLKGDETWADITNPDATNSFAASRMAQPVSSTSVVSPLAASSCRPTKSTEPEAASPTPMTR